MNWNNINFVNPEFFWLFLLMPFLIGWFFYKRNEEGVKLNISSSKGFLIGGGSVWAKFRPILNVLRLLAIAFLIIALARPRTTDVSTKTKTTRGIDIVMAIDVSASMLARDLKPNRLMALKNVAADFIKERVNDRIGLVVYAGESYTQVPITSDKRVVLSTLSKIDYNTNIENGTAIGMGLGTAVNRLKESKAKGKVIILLTDGVNNSGFIDPNTAAELALEYGIRTYTIGIGTNGTAMSPYSINVDGSFNYRPIPVEIDEELLKSIAERTGGRYFRATNNRKLDAIYDEINKLEKTEIEEFKFYNHHELFRSFAIIAGILILIELLLRYTVFRSFI